MIRLDLMERPFSQSEVKCLTLQLLKAVHCLHTSSVIHRDIKLSNMLLNNKVHRKENHNIIHSLKLS